MANTDLEQKPQHVCYADLAKQVLSLTEGETDEVALMATVACEIHHSDSRFDWTGFYRNTGGGVLKIGPYQGGHGCLVIPFGRGVCGAAAQSGKVQLIDDVDAFSDHIACSSSTRSELVIPVWSGERLIGVLDIDSDAPAAFEQADADELQSILNQVFGG